MDLEIRAVLIDSGGAYVLDARSYRRGAVLAETDVDLGIHDGVDFHLYVCHLKFDPNLVLIADIIAFKPRLLLLMPSFILIIVLLHLSELRNPLPSLLGIPTSTPSASTIRTTGTKLDSEGGSVSLSTGVDGEPIPVAPPREAESGVDYYMNLQALQNTMGWM